MQLMFADCVITRYMLNRQTERTFILIDLLIPIKGHKMRSGSLFKSAHALCHTDSHVMAMKLFSPLE